MKTVSLRTGRFCALPKGCLLALGCFDGVHIGHKALLTKSKECAEALGVPLAVWTPAGAKKTPQINSPAYRLKVLGDYAEYFVEEDFEKIRAFTPEEFVFSYLIGRLSVRALSCGENFTFGRDKIGNASTLRCLCDKYGLPLYVKESVLIDGHPVSDSTIRALLGEGDSEKAKKYLGRPYSFTAEQVSGNRIGRTIGFPTVNLPLPDSFLLPRGVYIVGLCYKEQKKDDVSIEHPAIANIGVHPTFSSLPKEICEVHLLDAPVRQLFGEELCVSFYKRIRPEQRFSSSEELKAQLEKDIAAARRFWIDRT